MVYEKNTWQSGDVITSAKLNNMESGLDTLNPFIISIVLSVEMDGYATTDKTLAEVQAALEAGHRIFVRGAMNEYVTIMAEVTAFAFDAEGNLEEWLASAVVPDIMGPSMLIAMQGVDNSMEYRFIPNPNG